MPRTSASCPALPATVGNLLMIRIISAVLLSLLLDASPAISAEKRLIAVSDASWPPLEFLDDTGRVVGFSADYLQAVAREVGLIVTISNMPWKDLFEALEAKKADIVVSSVTDTPSRRRLLGLSLPYYEARQAVLVRRGTRVPRLEALAGRRVGGQIGSTGLVATLPDAGVNADVRHYDEVALAVEALAAGDVDAVICDAPLAGYYAAKSTAFAGRLSVALVTGAPERYCFAVRLGDTALLEKLNNGIRAVRAKGLDRAIAAKWIGN